MDPWQHRFPLVQGEPVHAGATHVGNGNTAAKGGVQILAPSQQCPSFLSAIAGLATQAADPETEQVALLQNDLQQKINHLKEQIRQCQSQVMPVPLVSTDNCSQDNAKHGEKPKKSLSAYNIFFQMERKRLLKILPVKGKKPRNSHGKIGFADMARTIAARWKRASPEEKAEYQKLAALDKERYKRELLEYQRNTSQSPNDSVEVQSAAATINVTMPNFGVASPTNVAAPAHFPQQPQNMGLTSPQQQLGVNQFESVQQVDAFGSTRTMLPKKLEVGGLQHCHAPASDSAVFHPIDLKECIEPVDIRTQAPSVLDGESLSFLLDLLEE